MSMKHTVYKTTNLVNDKIYIGAHSTTNPYDDYLGSGSYFKKALIKYGPENFSKEVLHIFDDIENMYEKECELVNKEFIENPNTYNLIVGGQNGILGYRHSLNTRRRMSVAHTGKKHTETTIEKLRNRRHSEFTRLKMSEQRSGVKHWNYGKQLSDETKSKISNKNLGRKHSASAKIKISNANIGIHNGIKVKCVIDGIIYETIKEASIKLGINQSTIARRLKSTTGKFDNYIRLDEIHPEGHPCLQT